MIDARWCNGFQPTFVGESPAESPKSEESKRMLEERRKREAIQEERELRAMLKEIWE